MKIEMLESLAATWLKNIKNCQFVQTNWTPSASWPTNNMNLIDTLYKEAQLVFGKNKGFDCKLDQFISQAEIDIVGLCYIYNQNVSFNKENLTSIDAGFTDKKLYLVDTAFHANGLGYGNPQENVNRIIKKCLRAEICNLAYFNVSNIEIIFASPKINKATINILNNTIHNLKKLFAKFNLNVNLSIIYNEAFNNEILQPTIDIIDQTNDNDLFARSLSLYLMFYKQNNKLASQKALQQINAFANSTPVSNHIANLANYEQFLKSNGYTNSTAKSYCSAIASIMKQENMTFVNLFNNLSILCVDYNKAGSKSALGNKGHGTWRNSLIQLDKFKAYLISQGTLSTTITTEYFSDND